MEKKYCQDECARVNYSGPRFAVAPMMDWTEKRTFFKELPAFLCAIRAPGNQRRRKDCRVTAMAEVGGMRALSRADERPVGADSAYPVLAEKLSKPPFG
ncbi:hypothetical protein [Nitratireductor thuwali]|uniref:hypothetical protein n=1 Tax=Nitratireductor thuwali TaxID=2267699 RepID=UPI0030D1D1F0